MADKIFENNQVSIVGEIVSDFRFSHEVYGEGFYVVDVAVNRLSNFMDQKDRVFTPAFVANLFLIAGTVFLLLKGKINAYVGYDGAMHDGTALLLIDLIDDPEHEVVDGHYKLSETQALMGAMRPASVFKEKAHRKSCNQCCL